MSNRVAVTECAELIRALDDCQQSGLFARINGECFDLEKQVRLCRHEARMADRRKHAEVSLAKQRRQEERWRKIKEGEL